MTSLRHPPKPARASAAAYPASATRFMPFLLTITLAALGLRLFHLAAQPLWLDEALSLSYARLPLAELLTRLTISDVNPPFYYLFLRLWVVAGDSEFMLRLPSALAGAFTVLFTGLLGRRLGGPAVGLLAATFLSMSDMQLRYSQEARPYALMAMTAALALWGLVALLRPGNGSSSATAANGDHATPGPWPWLAYIAGTTVALHLHSTMALLPACANIIALTFWLTRGRRQRSFLWQWLAANTLVFILWSPVVILVLKQMAGVLSSTWMEPTDTHGAATMVANTYTTRAGGRWPMLLLGSFAAIGIWHWRRRRGALFITMAVAAGVPLMTFLISFWRPIMLQRTLLWPTAMVSILVAAGCLALRRRILVTLAVAILLSFQVVAVVRHSNRQVPEPWDAVVAQLVSDLQPGDVVVVAPDGYRPPFSYYYDRTDNATPFFCLARGTHPQVESLRPDLVAAAELPALFETYQRIWVVVREGVTTGGDDMRRILGEIGQPGPVAHFMDITISRFDAPSVLAAPSP